VKVRGQSVPARHPTASASGAAPKTATASASKARAPRLEGSPPDHGKLRGDAKTDWKGLAEVSKPGLFGQSTGLAALAQRYGLSEPSKPAEKFLQALSAIDEAMHGSKSAEKLADAMLNHDSRREVFRLEAQLRLFRDELGDKPLDLVKELEDHIGAVTSFEHAKKAAEKHGAPKTVVDRIGALQSASRDAVVKLVSEKWMPGKDGRSAPVALIAQAITRHDFGSEKTSRTDLARKLEAQVGKLKDGIGKLSMTDLEQGVHKMRRQLRWVALYLQAAGGQVQATTSQKPDAHYGPMMASTSAARLKEIFGEGLPPLRPGDKPIEVPQELYFGLQKAILELGEIKDDSEARELLHSAYEESGMKPAEIEKRLGKKGSPEDMTARATVIRDELERAKLLGSLKRAFEDAV
jgi:hypothetical protein